MSRRSGRFYWTTWVVVFGVSCGGVVRTGTSRDENGSGGASGKTGGGIGGSISILLPPDTGGYGAYPSGGYPTYGGSGGDGTTGSGGDDSANYHCLPPPPDPEGFKTEDDTCCQTSGGPPGTCLPESSLTLDPMKSAFVHHSCGAGLKCAPARSSLADGGASAFPSCSATLGAALNIEGRCVPKCFFAGHPLMRALKQDDCATDEFVCTPCYDPVDGTSTGACEERPGDLPDTTKQLSFSSCGVYDGGRPAGTCIPGAIVGALGYLGIVNGVHQDDCAAAGDACVPIVKAAGACFAPCGTGFGSQLGPEYENGACVPVFAVRDGMGNPAVAIFTQQTCVAGELCAPCSDPLNPGAPTHACE